MSNLLLITMLAVTTIATAEPYYSPIPAPSFYGSLFPSSYSSTVVQQAVPALVPEPVPAVVPATLPGVFPAAAPPTLPLSAAYTSADLASYAYGDYSSLYGVPNFAPLASAYSIPPYGYGFGNYFYKR